MKIYPITDTSTEQIDFKVSDDQFALVHHLKKCLGHFDEYKTIILSQREALTLYQAIQDSILKGD